MHLGANIQLANDFKSLYCVQDRWKDEGNPIVLSDSVTRRCRFCKRSLPEVTFEKEAHVLPQLIGNRNITNTFECDSCNNDLSLYESHFANFLGPLLQTWGVRGRNKIPVHRRTGRPVEEVGIKEELRLESIRDGNSNHLKFLMHGTMPMSDVEFNGNEIKLKLRKNSYTPQHVFRALLHAGFCLLPENELQDFELARKWLIDEDRRYPEYVGASIFQTTLPGRGLAPSIQLFRRKVLDPQLFSRIFIVGFERFIIQFHLATDTQVFDVARGRGYTAPFFQPFPLLRNPPAPEHHDLRSLEKRTDDFVTLAFMLTDNGVHQLLSQEGADTFTVE
jgi:HNH endonuclease